MSCDTWDRSFYSSLLDDYCSTTNWRIYINNFGWTRFSSTVEIISTFMHCGDCVHRYERESVTVEAICVVSLNYGECDTATRNCATEWSLRVTVTQLLKKGDMGWVIFSFKAPSFFTLQTFYVVHVAMAISCM